MNKWTELFVGLILVLITVTLALLTWGIGTWDFGTAAWEFFKGGLVWFVFMIGLLFIMLGIADLKEPAKQAAQTPAPMAPMPVESAEPKKRSRKTK